MMKFVAHFPILFALALAVGLNAWGQPLSPLQLVEATVNDVVTDMNANEGVYASDPDKLRAMVLERVAPHFNFNRMTQLAMAKHWSQATPEQRRRISEEMLQLMVRTYTNAMFTYRNQPFTLVDEKITNARSATVRLSVITASGQNASVILRLENRSDRWQVIDVVVEGVSMVITYRGTFAEEISKTGIDGLIESVRQDSVQPGVQ